MTLIHDSDDGSAPLPEGYVLTGSGNNFDLQIDVNEQNAMLTRCTVSGGGLLDATSTAMIYVVGMLSVRSKKQLLQSLLN